MAPEPPPTTLAGAIRLALDDAEAVRARRVDDGPGAEIYRPNASVWHHGCNVCLAGMVIARIVGYDENRDVELAQFDREWQRVFSALDHVRAANWERAAQQLWNSDGERAYHGAACERFEELVTARTGRDPFGPVHDFVGWGDFDRFAQTLTETALPAVEAAERTVRAAKPQRAVTNATTH